MSKPKVAFYWCASCGGCEEAVVDLAEDILTVVEVVDIVFWPVAMDFKREDVENMKDGEILVSFINGAIRLSEQEEMVKLLRRKSQLVIAFGSCAHLGGIPGLANQFGGDKILNFVYEDAPTTENPEKTRPQVHFKEDKYEFELPEFYDSVKALDQVIEVDYYIPGCAPPRNIVKDAVTALLKGELPSKGSVLASDKSLCHECPLNETKPEKIEIKEFKRPHQVEIDPEKCLLLQGLICLGPVTRGGCDALCIKGNMPCTGCFGPLDGVIDYGAKALSYLASIIDSNDEKEIEEIMKGIPDPLGTFYRYSLPKSLLFKTKR
ncbi:MAG TPA: oxidoreductase [Candidatus Altiarchaeales archaeon]|nr:oxidoreductase [Candidatus Altiarchaeales archaeon]